MSHFCKKAVAQCPAIVWRFMGRYPPTARSFYKPPTSDNHRQQSNSHLLQQFQNHHTSYFQSILLTGEIRKQQQAIAVLGLHEVIKMIEECLSADENVTGLDVLALINAIVATGCVLPPLAYLILLKLLFA